MENEIRDRTAMTTGIGRRQAFASAAMLGLGAAGLAGGIRPAAAAETAGLPKKNLKFFFVCHVTLDQFFTPAIYGAQDACAAFQEIGEVGLPAGASAREEVYK